jgi:hypothetical protein
MKTKLLISLLMAIMVVALQVGAAAAAPLAQDPTPVDPVPTEDACGTEEVIPPTEGETVTPTETGDTTETEEPTEDTAPHPVGDALSAFFCGAVGVSYDDIMGFHDDGYGFGVIAQALWAANELGLDPAAILAAKSSGDYTGIVLPDGSTPTNWGQFRKGLMKHTLGEIVSGKADPLDETGEAAASAETTHGKGHIHGQGGGKGKGHNK